MLAKHLMVGVVAKAQGILGEVKIKPLTDDPDRFAVLSEVLVKRGNALEPVSLSFVRVHQGFVYAHLDGATTRNQAEAQRGWKLYVDRQHAVPLPEDHHFIVDLVGCHVQDTQGRELGTLTEVLQPGANDVYVVKGQRNLMVPVLKRVIRSVDVDQRLIVLDAQVLPEVAVFED